MIVAVVLVSFAAGCVLGVWISTALTATFARHGAVCHAAPVEKKPRAGPAGPGEGRPRPRLVQSRRMLTTVQQEAVSALMNLGANFRDAEGAVLAATSQIPGQGFDEVFRVAVVLLNARKARKAAC